MQNAKNFVQLIGNIGGDPEQHNLPDGTIKANVSLATNETYKNAEGEKVIKTQWHRLTMWRKTAEIALKYWKKGNTLLIWGQLQYGSYDDKDGIKRYTTDIVVNSFEFVGGSKVSDNGQTNHSAPTPQAQPQSNGQAATANTKVLTDNASAAGVDDDLPF